MIVMQHQVLSPAMEGPLPRYANGTPGLGRKPWESHLFIVYGVPQGHEQLRLIFFLAALGISSRRDGIEIIEDRKHAGNTRVLYAG
jgi:hypothetical protein